LSATPGLLARWTPSPFLRGCLVLHAVLLGWVVLQPAQWPFALALLVAMHLILSTVGLVPRGTLLGPNITRLPPAAVARREVAITIDDGPDPAVTPAVLELLARHRVRATFFCIGERVEAHPDIAREIVRQGHAIENHTARHYYRFSTFGSRRLAREIDEAQDTIGRVTGRRPEFFRAPAGLRNPLLQPVLSQLGLRLASWTRRGFDTVAGDAGLVVRRLLRGLAPGDILLLHDGRAARTADGTPVILAALPGLLEALAAAELRPVTLREACAGDGVAG
jgi:peptidoglycan/xylan/chitin deacetylase (PgdA/CDA1 family)